MSSNFLKQNKLLSKGYGLISQLAMRDKNLTIEAKAIYSYLCSFAGAGDTAFPSVSLICSELGISEDRFYKHRKHLIQRGYISVEQQKEAGKMARNIYHINQDIPESAEDSPYPCFTGTENTGTEISGTGNKGTKSNSSTSTSITNSKKEKRDKAQEPIPFPGMNSSNQEEPKKKKQSIPPSLEEVEAYIKEKGYGLDAEEFMDGNAQRGWILNNGKKMADWKAAVRTWERNRIKWSNPKPKNKTEEAIEEPIPAAFDW